MTQATELGTAASPGETAEERVLATVRALKAATRTSTPDICATLGMSRTTWFSRMKGETPFTIGEAATLADYFGCSVQDLFDGVVRVNTPSRHSATKPVNLRYSLTSVTPVTPRSTLTRRACLIRRSRPKFTAKLGRSGKERGCLHAIA